MEKNYNEVPSIISTKDLSYLSDMFQWNYGAYKMTVNAIPNMEDEELKNMLETSSNTFYETMQDILNILNMGGNNE